MPGPIQDKILQKTSISAEFREGVIEYYIQYSPRATWAELAGELYFRECGKALAAARRFIQRTPGKCVNTVNWMLKYFQIALLMQKLNSRNT